jgi:hypothetical protein
MGREGKENGRVRANKSRNGQRYLKWEQENREADVVAKH